MSNVVLFFVSASVELSVESDLSDGSGARLFHFKLKIYDGLQTAHSPRCEWGGRLSCHRMAHCVLIRCFPQPSRASPRLFAYVTFLVSAQTAPPRGASGERNFLVTAWRTACLYGVSHSRTSPMYTDNVTSSLSGTDSTLSEVRVHTIPTSV